MRRCHVGPAGGAGGGHRAAASAAAGRVPGLQLSAPAGPGAWRAVPFFLLRGPARCERGSLPHALTAARAHRCTRAREPRRRRSRVRAPCGRPYQGGALASVAPVAALPARRAGVVCTPGQAVIDGLRGDLAQLREDHRRALDAADAKRVSDVSTANAAAAKVRPWHPLSAVCVQRAAPPAAAPPPLCTAPAWDHCPCPPTRPVPVFAVLGAAGAGAGAGAGGPFRVKCARPPLPR
jgi:hypothetical protein